MNYIIAVFHSRNETLNYTNLLRVNNIPCSIINTPKEAIKDCGISVKFLKEYFDLATNLLNQRRFMTFLGFFSIEFNNGRNYFIKIR